MRAVICFNGSYIASCLCIYGGEWVLDSFIVRDSSKSDNKQQATPDELPEVSGRPTGHSPWARGLHKKWHNKNIALLCAPQYHCRYVGSQLMLECDVGM